MNGHPEAAGRQVAGGNTFAAAATARDFFSKGQLGLSNSAARETGNDKGRPESLMQLGAKERPSNREEIPSPTGGDMQFRCLELQNMCKEARGN